MKKNENVPLNFREKSISRISFYVSIGVLAVLFLIFNQIDYNMIRKPAQQARKKPRLRKNRNKRKLRQRLK